MTAEWMNSGWVMALLGLLIAVTMALDGLALWYSARAGQKGWFVAILLLNTAGILEIVYLVWFRPKPAPVQASVPPVQ